MVHPLQTVALSADKAQLLRVLVGLEQLVGLKEPQLQVLVGQAQQPLVNQWPRPELDSQGKVQQRVQSASVASMLLVPLRRAGTLSRSRLSTAQLVLRVKSIATWRTRTSDSALKWRTVSGFLNI